MSLLYQLVADEIAQHIGNGVYAPGERLPAVRMLAQARKVSVATTIAADQLLVDAGHVEARPRSGFYVRTRRPIQTIEAQSKAIATPPRLVTGQAMAMALIKAANDPAIVPLGAAVPEPTLLPTHALRRALSQAER